MVHHKKFCCIDITQPADTSGHGDTYDDDANSGGGNDPNGGTSGGN